MPATPVHQHHVCLKWFLSVQLNLLNKTALESRKENSWISHTREKLHYFFQKKKVRESTKNVIKQKTQRKILSVPKNTQTREIPEFAPWNSVIISYSLFCYFLILRSLKISKGSYDFLMGFTGALWRYLYQRNLQKLSALTRRFLKDEFCKIHDEVHTETIEAGTPHSCMVSLIVKFIA